MKEGKGRRTEKGDKGKGEGKLRQENGIREEKI